MTDPALVPGYFKTPPDDPGYVAMDLEDDDNRAILARFLTQMRAFVNRILVDRKIKDVLAECMCQDHRS